MNASEFLNLILASGADEKGILDRFGENADLYKMCFLDFMDEPNFTALRDAVHTKNYEQAFHAAHALKGLSGNLGITGFYDAIRDLTASLRNSQYDLVGEKYAEVERQHDRLKQIISGTDTPAEGENSPDNSLENENPSVPDNGSPGNWTKDRIMFVYLMLATVLVIFAIGMLFCRINVIHNRKVTEESGLHLTEISNQIVLYIEDHIAFDWRVAQSVGDSILDSSYVNNDSDMLEMLRRKQEIWGVSDLMLYTEHGYCIYADGSTEATDIASRNVYNARSSGRSLSVLDSRLIYTVPLDTSLTFGGSRIVAVSVVRDMSSILDDMNFSSFGGSAWMYLTKQNGILISSLSSPSTDLAFNIQSIVRNKEIRPIDEAHTPEDFLTNPDTAAFLLTDDNTEIYGVSAPVRTGDVPMSLFYFVPEAEVNQTMSGFARQLLIFSMIIIFLFAVCAFVASLYVYKSRKELFDRAILSRERMFDLLVKNTKTAFGLFTPNNSKPDYASANASGVVDDLYWALDKTDSGFRIHNDRNVETENLALVNETLKDWDGKSTFRSGYLCNRKNATPTYFVFELYPVNEDKSSFVGIAQDVTPIYAREEAVRNAMEMATQANEAKTRFLSHMSHDIRTPMNAIMNMSSFALENIDQPKKLGNYLHVIHESAEHLLHLVNDVLDMSRIESGHLVVASAPFNLREELQRQAEMIRPLCQEKNQTFITDFEGLKETSVSGDAMKLSQIVINLLTNAMKFTPEKGAVRFSAKEIPSLRDNIVTVRLSVEDNGIGIAESYIKKIFDPFSRANDSIVNQIEGTGLGLTIVKNYVDAMGGKIDCESELNEGSTFTVELFFPRTETDVKKCNLNASLTNASFLGMHALVVEDNRTNQLIARELLERMGFLLDFAGDGSEAVRMFTDSAPNTYDVIYMDIQMPVMDGYEATLLIRAGTHPQARTIPIITMSANAFTEDIAKAQACGMDGYVEKPIISFYLAEQTKKVITAKRGETK